MNLTEHLRANPDLISLDRATLYLASRVRARTPFGASEYLRHKVKPRGQAAPIGRGRITSDERYTIALECMRIYRTLFPVEWSNSTSAYLSIQREQELYRLIDEQLFPFRVHDSIDVAEIIERDPRFFAPFIPLRGQQRFMWMIGQFTAQEIGPAFCLALTLSRQMEAYGQEKGREFSWETLRDRCGVPETVTPAPPLASVGWSLFCYSCAVEESPLLHLPLAFHFITYQTKNPWIDVPPVGMFGWDWSLEKIAELTTAQFGAQQMGDAITQLASWLQEDPAPRITRAVELWNDASAKERQSGGEGLLRDEQTGQFYRREDWF